MELTEYQNLLRFISSGFTDFPDDLEDTTTKKGKNQREYYKRKAEKTYFVNDDRLYRFSAGNAQGVEVVKDGQQIQVLKEFHSSSFGGHSGVNKTINAIQKRYWWNGLTEDVKKFIRSCEKCQRSDPLRPPQRPELHTIQVSHPFELVGVDLMGPFVESSQGNKYIFTATDYYTKWVEAFPIPNKTAAVVSKCFEKMFSRHGAMNAIITDQGREFINEINSKLCEAWNIEHRVTAAYHPQTNGLDERTNQTIKTALRKLTNEDQTDWDQHLDAVLFSLRTKSQYTTKFSPFFLLYGREAVYPSKLPKNFKVDESPQEPTAEDIEEGVSDRQETSEKVNENVRENMKKAQDKQKKDFKARSERGRKFILINVGDKVLVHNSRRYNKKSRANLSHNYDGPYIVIDIEGTKATLKNEKGVVLKKKYSVDRLKLYQEEKAGSGEKKPTEEHCAEPKSSEEYSAEAESQREKKDLRLKIVDFINTICEEGQYKQLLEYVMQLEEIKRTFNSGQHSYWVDSCPVFSFWSEVTKESDEATLIFAQELLKLLKHLPIDLRKKTSTVMIMAGVCSMAMKKNQPVLTVTSTLKLKPDHMEVVQEAAGPLRKVKVAGEVLEKADFKTLDEGQWLNDKIMNAFLALLRMRQNEGDTHVFVIPSYAAVLWTAGNLEHWLFRRVQFSLFKLILMPINVNENHWVLLVANVKERTVTVLDSMNGKDGQRYAGIWRKFMKKRDDAIEEKLGDWCIVQTPCNQQKDGSSCGVFALMNAECIIKDVPHDIMRQVHAKGYRNYIRNRLLIAASQNTTDKCDATDCRGKRAGKRSLQCTVCGRWMHIKCVNITARAARDIHEYVCLFCEAMYS